MLHQIQMNQIKYQKKVKAILTKGLTNDLINKFRILKAGKFFSSGKLQKFLVFIPAKKIY